MANPAWRSTTHPDTTWAGYAPHGCLTTATTGTRSKVSPLTWGLLTDDRPRKGYHSVWRLRADHRRDLTSAQEALPRRGSRRSAQRRSNQGVRSDPLRSTRVGQSWRLATDYRAGDRGLHREAVPRERGGLMPDAQ